MALTADTPQAAFQRAAIPPLPVCRLGVDRYEEMIQAGMITKEDRIELLDGWIMPKMTKNPPHVLATELMRDALARAVPEGWCVFVEPPVRLPGSMPEPDVVVLRGDARRYGRQRMLAEDAGLIVEVADASLDYDRGFKKHLYAQAGIAIYWLVNLIDQRIEVYSGPAGPDEAADYRQRRDYSASEEMPLVLDGRPVASIAVGAVLP
jgi:Uma2 family endonuclease